MFVGSDVGHDLTFRLPGIKSVSIFSRLSEQALSWTTCGRTMHIISYSGQGGWGAAVCLEGGYRYVFEEGGGEHVLGR